MKYEDSVLGAVLLNPNIYPELTIEDRHLESPNAKRALRAIRQCVANGVTPTLVDLVDVDKNLDYSYVASLTTNTPASTNWRHYEREVIDAYKRRSLRQLGEDLQKWGKDISRPVADTLDDTERALSEILSEGSHDEIHHMADVMLKVANRVEERWHSKGELPGVSTGFKKLDGYMMGFEPGKLYIVAGRPSTGKSALLLTMAREQATHKLAKPAYISLESSELETGNRALAQQARYSGYKLLTGYLDSERDFTRIVTAAGDIGNSDWFIYDRANATLEQVRSAARRMVLMNGCNIVYVDYMQIISGQGRDSKYDHITRVSMALKQLARDLRVPVVCAAQLNRASHDKRPAMAELKESGQIEQDADTIMLLHRPKRTEEMQRGADVWDVSLIVDKNRDGALGDVSMHFKAEYILFTEAPAETFQDAV